MTPVKAVLVAVLAFAAMSTAGYVAADLALSDDDAPRITPAGDRVTIVSSSLQGSLGQQSRALAAVTPTPSPTASPQPTPTAEAAVVATDTPLPPATEPPTATPEPPTPTPEPPTATPEPPTPTPEPPTPTPEPQPTSGIPTPPEGADLLLGSITSYADALAGSTLGCSGYGAYDPNNPTIIAVGPDHYEEWPCGTRLGLCGIDAQSGVITNCIVGIRQDSCPGCISIHLDVSRAAFEMLCGPNVIRCAVAITRIE